MLSPQSQEDFIRGGFYLHEYSSDVNVRKYNQSYKLYTLICFKNFKLPTGLKTYLLGVISETA